MRRCLPLSAGSTVSFTGSSTVTVTLGNQRRRICAAMQPRERRGIEPFEPHRHHEGIGLVGNQPGAVVDLHQAAGDGEAPLREDDQRLAALDRVDQGAGRHRLGRIERHRAGEAQERLHPPVLRHRAVDGEHRVLGQQRQRQRRVEEARVIERDDRVVAGVVEVLDARDLDAIERAEQDREEIHHRVGRHGAGDERRRRRAWQAPIRMNSTGVLSAERLQHRDDDGAADHEGGVEHVDRRR